MSSFGSSSLRTTEVEVIMIAPVVAITVALQKQIARGILVGALKG